MLFTPAFKTTFVYCYVLKSRRRHHIKSYFTMSCNNRATILIIMVRMIMRTFDIVLHVYKANSDVRVMHIYRTLTCFLMLVQSISFLIGG